MIIFKKDIWIEIFQVLRKNKLRTFITSFGVIWGLFMLMIMLGAGSGLENAIGKSFGDFATNSFFLWPQQTTISYNGFRKGRSFTFKESDTQALLNQVDEIKYLSSRIMDHSGKMPNTVTRGSQSASFSVIGDYPDYVNIDPFDFPEGRFINRNDIEESRNVCVLGKDAYETLFKKGEKAVGTWVKVNGTFCQVIGVMNSRHGGGWGRWQNSWVVLPISTLRRINNMGDVVGFYGITVKDGYSATQVSEKVMKILSQRHSIAPDDKQAFGLRNIEENYLQMKGLFTGINVLVLIIGVGTLLAGVIGISNIMLITIKERTKEIGIRRAIGARPSAIVWQIIFESTLITFIAGYIGMLLGMLVVDTARMVVESFKEPPEMFQNPTIDPGIVLGAFVIIIISGMLAGILPAIRAVKIKPIEAIRT